MTGLWHLDGAQAKYASEYFTAEIDLAHPEHGLSGIRWQHVVLGAYPLRVKLADPPFAETVIDAWQRQGDLVVTYAESSNRPVRRQVYWRVLPDIAGLAGAPIEVIVSVQTSLLHSDPRIAVSSRLFASEAYASSSPDAASFREVPLPSDEKPQVVEATGAGLLLLYRLANRSKISYAEMLPASDATVATLSVGNHGEITTDYPLFGKQLEKGVILRSRVRGVFLPRENDQDLAAQWYAHLLASELPLTT